LYATIAKQLRFHHLTENSQGWCRLLVEKPFGVDLETSRALNKELLSVFPEKDIFRIDHFLAKETVQNILAFRFANGVFENLWNSQYVDHIQVTSAEPMGVEGRERFYNDVGVVRDVVQNHVLSLLAIALMEEPATFDPKSIQKERLRLLSQIEVLSETAVGERVKFGQYSQSDQESLLERSVPTAVALRLSVLSRRWHGVPIYIRAGKKLPCRVTELSVVFKEPLNRMFDKTNTKQPPNILTFRIQPNEGIILCINVKKPGFEYGIERVPMSFCYSSSFTDSQLPEAYSKVIYDAIKGDVTLFLDEQGVDASWEAVQSMLVSREEVPAEYETASWGPESFSTLIQKDGREWIEPDLSSCSLR
ncbi:glucose-6-phosphate dehydrogenase (NADP(+)), partial [Candidatus Woesebacteria bacterium]|nr:glucose-6-phosphate dehydrogenase (NADP(+)) [Candidatus Woesebacteria bacterium]